MKTVVIFGGSGFLGSHLIRRIAKNGHKIIIPYKKKAYEEKLRLFGNIGQIIPFKFMSLKEKIISNILSKADVVINLRTQWDEKNISYESGIEGFNIELVDILKNSNPKAQFIFFSGIAVENDKFSIRSQSIYNSENYIQKNLINSVIVKPGIVIGGGDKFLKNLILTLKISFIFPLFGKGLSKFQPIYVDDVSVGVNKIIQNFEKGKHIFEFAGNEIFSYKYFFKLILSYSSLNRLIIPIPLILINSILFFLEKTPFSPLNREQLRLFKQDNVASNKYKNLSNLNINPQNLREIIKKTIKKNI